METAAITHDTPTATSVAPAEVPAEVLVEEELLIEEISIDGMCGVY
jgi:mycofactocin precursor